jgi:hypothetical protein
MHVLGLYNLVVALGVAGACSVCIPVATHDTASFGGGGSVKTAGGGYWADFPDDTAKPNRRAYFPSARERDAARRPDSRDAAKTP